MRVVRLEMKGVAVGLVYKGDMNVQVGGWGFVYVTAKREGREVNRVRGKR